LDDPERGFSFSRTGPLDMRMGDDAQRLGDYLETVSEHELTSAIRDLGEERFARPIAKAIQRERPADTSQLAAVIASAIPRSQWPTRIHPATKTFQALRMVINRELESLDALLSQIKGLLAIGGRAVVISFHSLEDRRVKEAFRGLVGGCTCPRNLPVCVCGGGGDFQALTKKAAVASEAETARNPRSRSARLRAVERMR
jgi:16S rRNA (cytosine1402-N4)-methyltransferase